MYESPIEIIKGAFTTECENGVMTAVQKYGVNVDKEELIKALNYDREQYRKGFEDGVQSRSMETTTWESCGEFWEHRSGLEKFKCNCCGGEVILYFGAKYPNFCPYCGRKSIADTGYERKLEYNGYGFMLITERRLNDDGHAM